MKIGSQGAQGMGRVYAVSSNEPVAEVKYSLSEWVSLRGGSGSVKWQGTFTTEGEHPKLEGEYIIELQDKRRGKVTITLVEKQAGVPIRYHFRGWVPWSEHI